MKFLFFILVLSGQVFGESKPADGQEVFLDAKELSTKFVSVIQSSKIEDQLIQSGEFKKCADQNKFDPSKSRDEQVLNQATAAGVMNCFNTELKRKSPEELIKLSEKLNLNGFNLVKSKNVQEITKFLSNNLYKKMTGIDLEEKDVAKKLASMKFNNAKRTQVDQRDFTELYRVQLGKSALYEISRFCFLNLRLADREPITTFAEHWKDRNPSITDSNLTDNGVPAFGSFTGSSDKKEIYTEIKDSFSSSDYDPEKTKKFFNLCMDTIDPLCKIFQKNNQDKNSLTASPATSTTNGPEKIDSTPSKTSLGANACLTQKKLQEIRRAMAKTSDVLDDMDKIGQSSTTIKIENSSKNYNFKDQGNGYNSLTAMTSEDFLSGETQDENKFKKCETDPNAKECEAFLIKDDSLKKSLHDTDFKMRLKHEIEKETLSKLEGEKLKEYIDERGYLQLKDITDKKTLLDEYDKMIDAQRAAVLEEIKNKVGHRQLDSDHKDSGPNKEQVIKNNILNFQEEKSRLAQVVLFNNIISSTLTLKAGTGKDAKEIGKNTLGLEKEKVAGEYIKNLQAKASDKDSGGGTDEYLKDIEFLDEVIGAKKD